MPSISAYVVTFFLKLKGLKRIFSQDPIPYTKLRKDDVWFPPAKVLKNTTATTVQILDTEITILNPKKKVKNTDYVLLYCPGGAFVSGPNLVNWESLSTLVQKTGIAAWMVNYPKAPEHKMLELSKNIDAVYKAALEQYDASKIILMGDSAGGNLILSLTQRLLKGERPLLPSCLIPISPVMDCSLENAAIEAIDKKDPMLSKKGVLSAKKMSMGTLSLKDPMLSPLYGSFEGFPPVYLFMGTNDILFPDQQLAGQKMEQAGVVVEMIQGEGMPHIWPLLPFMKEAQQALQKIETIITKTIHS